ncbi:MAG: nickel-dependent hydrogenase large subunit [Spirochaetota bacterium]|nr:nickel-dependent hydrogenase large subunit [Spirochaetota bacterium]
MAKRVVVDPVTRIEGHLRIEAVVENGVIKDAFSSGTMVRGIEIILRGRDPRDAWAFTERVCGVCTTVHALASVRTVEDAIGISVPQNAELIRNLMFCAQYLQDHVIHFYHLHALDWVDIISALKADPKEASVIAQDILGGKLGSKWAKTSPAYFSDLKKKLEKFASTGQLGIFANGYWGHPDFKLPPAVNLIAVAHYLEALEWQKEIVKIHAIFGGKNPHPNYLVGGVPCSLNINELNAINTERLNHVGKLIDDAIDIVNNMYVPDLLAIAGFYKDTWTASKGGGLNNYLAYGDLPVRGYNKFDYKNPTSFKFPRGAILNFPNDLSIHEINPRDKNKGISEYIKHSWYKYSGGDDKNLHPWDGETELNYTGKDRYEYLDVQNKYSWLKTPRWKFEVNENGKKVYKDHAMEVGPLARMIVGYANAAANNKADQDFKTVVDDTLKKLGVPITALHSTLGRTAARGLETILVCKWTKEFFSELIANIKAGNTSTHNGEKWDPNTWHSDKPLLEGVGMTEAPRGALAHWIRIEDKKIKNYQLVVPTTWNASPRDANNIKSAYEEALIGVPMKNIDQPLEIIRTIHSFDPCLACAVHLYDPNGQHIHQIKVG